MNGNPSNGLDNLKRAYMASFTWGHVRTYLPVYLLWLTLITLFYFLFLATGVIYFYFPYLIDGDSFYKNHFNDIVDAFEKAVEFFALLLFLQIPYFLIFRRYKNALMAAMYFVMSLIGGYAGLFYVLSFKVFDFLGLFWCREPLMAFCN